MSTFNIDFFELAFLAEVCVPPVPIARSHFWDKLCDIHYHKMSDEERERLLEWLRPILTVNNKDCDHFVARFSKENQYVVVVNNLNSKPACFDCYLWEEQYHLLKNKFISRNHIVKVVKKY
jgi:hypothetical protein